MDLCVSALACGMERDFPDYLEEFTGWLRAQPEVAHVYSYSDIIKRLNKNMHNDDAAYYATPDDREIDSGSVQLDVSTTATLTRAITLPSELPAGRYYLTEMETIGDIIDKNLVELSFKAIRIGVKLSPDAPCHQSAKRAATSPPNAAISALLSMSSGGGATMAS